MLALTKFTIVSLGEKSVFKKKQLNELQIAIIISVFLLFTINHYNSELSHI